jgi:molybdopterin molybdotransferase
MTAVPDLMSATAGHHGVTATEDMTSVAAHRAGIIAAVAALPPRRMGLEEADGAVLAEDVTARWPLPMFDNSAMDGYAVLSSDVAGATPAAPVTLPVEAEVTAGDPRSRRLTAGTCVKITTGAARPAGAGAVVRAEWTDGGLDRAAITRPVRPGESVRRAGGEVLPGDLLLAAGTALDAPQVALLAAAGQHVVLARPRPRLTVLSAGNELAGLGGSVHPGQVWESNSLMLAAAARGLGCAVRRHPLARDDKRQVRAALRAAALDSDLLVTSGGISMGGEHDVFKAALRGLDTVTFQRVAMQPGMPQGFGTIGEPGVPILLLPGNPVSAFVSFCLFAGPAVRALQGRPREAPRTTTAVLTAPVRSSAGKASFISAVLDPAAGTVTPAGESAHHLTALARANALIVVPSAVTEMAQGELAGVMPL